MRELFNQVAKHLLGISDVVVRLMEPANPGSIGQTSRFGRTWFIDVSPGLSDDDRLEVLLHECGHVALHDIDGSFVPFMASGSYQGRTSGGGYVSAAKAARQENEADRMADDWLAMAKSLTWDHTPSGLCRALLEIERE